MIVNTFTTIPDLLIHSQEQWFENLYLMERLQVPFCFHSNILKAPSETQKWAQVQTVPFFIPTLPQGGMHPNEVDVLLHDFVFIAAYQHWTTAKWCFKYLHTILYIHIIYIIYLHTYTSAGRCTKIWCLTYITFLCWLSCRFSELRETSKDCDLGVGVGFFDLCGDRVFCSRARIHQAGVGRLNLLM